MGKIRWKRWLVGGGALSVGALGLVWGWSSPSEPAGVRPAEARQELVEHARLLGVTDTTAIENIQVSKTTHLHAFRPASASGKRATLHDFAMVLDSEKLLSVSGAEPAYVSHRHPKEEEKVVAMWEARQAEMEPYKERMRELKRQRKEMRRQGVPKEELPKIPSMSEIAEQMRAEEKP